MSWSSRGPSRRAVTGGLLAGGALLLAGCGFRPLYGRDAAGGSASDTLAGVYIEPLTDRTGQQLHNLLRDRINPRGQPVKPDYKLSVQLTEHIEELGIRKDETATRANLRLTAQFELIKASDGALLFRGRSQAVNSYNVLQSPFATYTSEQDARERGLRVVSDEIRTRLAAFLTKPT